MDFSNMVSLTDFTRGRDMDKQKITVYINRHPEIKAHVHYDKMNRNATYLDDEAVRLLSKKYPMTTQIITDSELYEQVLDCNNRLLDMTGIVMDFMEQFKQNDNNLLEKTEHFESDCVQALLSRMDELTDEIKQLSKENELQRSEIQKLNAERDNMLNMGYFELHGYIARLKRKNEH